MRLGLVALALALGLPEAAAAPSAPDLVGRWVIDAGASDEEGRRVGPPGGAGAPSGAFPAPVLREFAGTPEELLFERDPDGTLTLDDGNSVSRLYADGRRFKRANGLLESTVKLKDGALLVESQPGGGGVKVTVAYSTDAQGHLLVDATLKPPQGKPLQRRRVYKRAPPD